jgi:arginase
MTVIAVPYHQDEYLPGLDFPLEPAEVITAEITGTDPWERLAAPCMAVTDAVARDLRRGGRPVVLTGDCSTSLGVVAGLQRAGTEPGIVWFDAHGDVQTPQTSTSGYLGGMPLRLLAGYQPGLIATRLGLRPVPEDQIVLAGARDLDPPEREYLSGAPIRQRQVTELAAGDLPPGDLYVHVDLDVIGPPAVPGLRYPVPGGPDPAQLAAALRLLTGTGRVAAITLACTWRPGQHAAAAVAPYLEPILAGW